MIYTFGAIRACSRCPGWQTQDAQKALDHAKKHYAIDLASGICPVCLSTFPAECGHDGRKRSQNTRKPAGMAR